MDAPVAAYLIATCLVLGSLTGAADSMKESFAYEDFIENPGNYHLVDNAGNPVSQETE